MTGEKQKLLARLYREWVSEPEAALPLLHEEFEFVNPDYAVEGGTRHGHEGWLAANESGRGAFDRMEYEIHEQIEVGESVLCLTTFRARTRDSGIPYEVAEQQLWTFREGKIARLQWFHDEAEAREAAGLAPSGDLVLVVGAEEAIARAHEVDLQRALGRQPSFWFRSLADSDAALKLLGELRERGGRVALLVADDESRPVGGLELVARARELHPDLKAIALVAHKNYPAALAALSEGHLDRQLVKPIAPSGKQLVAEASDLLADWSRRREYAERAVRLVCDPETSEAWQLREFLSRNDVQYLVVDPDSADGRALLRGEDGEELAQPLVALDNGKRLAKPDLLELTRGLGMPTRPKGSEYDLLIVGGGPAGLAGAVYAASEGLRTCLIEREAPGGQAGQSSRIENYLGFPAGLTGTDLAQRALAQCRRFGAEIVRLKVAAGLESDGDQRLLRLEDDTELRGTAVLVACGVTYRRLEAPGIAELTGRGVHYGATAGEAERFGGRRVVIVGGANSAGQAALKLAEHVEQVMILVRGDGLDTSMSSYLCTRIDAHPTIEVRTETTVAAVSGDGGLERVELSGPSGERSELEAQGLFIFIGAVPHTDWLAGTVARESRGFILTGREARDACDRGEAPTWPLDRDPFPLESSVPGVFAAGDVRHGSIKRVAAAVGEGGTAVQLMHDYLAELREREPAAS